MKDYAKWNGWMAVNDSVMGGVSVSRPEATDRGSLRFMGTLSLDNNGGFASIRNAAEYFDINEGDGIMLRIRGDGRTYQLRLRTSGRFDGMAYKVDFETVKDEWQEHSFPWSVFTATFRGRLISDAPQLNAADVKQVGVMIADKQPGPFELEIKTLEAL